MFVFNLRFASIFTYKYFCWQ